MTDDRAVSEVVGFILVFSLVLGTITFVYVGGFGGLQDARDHEQNENAERAFDVLANNLDEIGRDKAPSRATEIKLSDSSLTVGDNSLRRVEIHANDTTAVAQPRPIIHRTQDDTEIIYESGAVFRQDDGGAVMIREPDFVFDEDRTVVRYLEPRGGQQSMSGAATVLVRAERAQSRVLMSESDESGVTVELNFTTAAERADVWEEFFETSLETVSTGPCLQDPSIGEGAVRISCEFETDSIYVARTRLSIQLS